MCAQQWGLSNLLIHRALTGQCSALRPAGRPSSYIACSSMSLFDFFLWCYLLGMNMSLGGVLRNWFDTGHVSFRLQEVW